MSKIENIKDILEFISLKNGEQHMCLRIFDRTPLRETSYIKIDILDSILRFNGAGSYPGLWYWDEYKKDDGTVAKRWLKRDSDDRLSIPELLESCEEIKYYVDKYYPAYTI